MKNLSSPTLKKFLTASLSILKIQKELFISVNIQATMGVACSYYTKFANCHSECLNVVTIYYNSFHSVNMVNLSLCFRWGDVACIRMSNTKLQNEKDQTLKSDIFLNFLYILNLKICSHIYQKPSVYLCKILTLLHRYSQYGLNALGE